MVGKLIYPIWGLFLKYIRKDMNLSDVFFLILYGFALFFILYIVIGRHKNKVQNLDTVNEASVISEAVWWPWAGSSYNHWSYWTGWWNSGRDGGYNSNYNDGKGAWNGTRPYGGGVRLPVRMKK